jgi:hypothetical protein
MSVFIISSHMRLYFLNGPFHHRIPTALLHASVSHVQIISLRLAVLSVCHYAVNMESECKINIIY